MSPFELATALAPVAGQPLVYRGTIPDAWQQGKGAFGGVSVGLLARAIVLAEASAGESVPRALRSLSADLCAPAMPGEVEIRVEVLRRGGSMTFLDARTLQAGAVIAHASASLASGRAIAPPGITPGHAPAGVPPWTDVPTVPVQPPFGPVFGAHYEYRSAGPMPFSGGTSATALGYIREKTPPAVHDEASIAGLLDAWWPTIMPLHTMPRAIATVGYTMQLLVDPRTLPASEPLLYRAEGVAEHDTFFVEMRELWSGGRRVAMNQQTFAVLS